MLLAYCCTLVMVVALTRGNENAIYRAIERDDEMREIDNEASFDYGQSNSFRSSATTASVSPPVLPQTPLRNIEYYGIPNQYYHFQGPETAFTAAYRPGAMLNNPALMCSLMPRFGYSSQPYFERRVYPGFQAGLHDISYYPRIGIPAPITGAPASPVGPSPSVFPPVSMPAQRSIPVHRFSNEILGAATSEFASWVPSNAGKSG